MDWIKKHADTIVILGSFALCFWTMNEKMNDGFSSMDKRFNELEKDVVMIKTVMIMKNIMPVELASNSKE
jgi:hypothetical protein